MNRGLVHKALRETWLTTLLIGMALLLFEALLAIVLPTLEEDILGLISQMAFMQRMLSALLGTDVSSGFGRESLQAIAWVHPVALALVWAHSIIMCTRVPAGEVERGTADVLFSMPVSRWAIYRAETLVWIGSTMALLVLALAGNRIGAAIEGTTPPVVLGRLWLVLINLYALILAVGAIAWLVSAASERRGQAIAIVFAIVLAWFLLNFLGQLWEPARHVSFLGLLEYYRPIELIRGGAFPAADAAVLAAVAAAAWTAGGVVLTRRDIATV